MTSTTDKAGHPDVAEISDLTEGLLPPSRSEDVRRHLDGCVLCADVYDSLEEIRGLLGTLPGPPRMPDDVAGRIDAALAAEALLSATTTDEAPDTDTPRPHVSRETSTAGRPSGHPRAGTGPGRPGRARRRRGTVALLGTAFVAAALGVSVILVQTGNDSSDKNPPGAHRPESSAQDTFSTASLQTHVSDLLAKNKKKSVAPSGSEKPWGAESQDTGTDSGGVGTFMTPTPSVPNCVKQGAGDEGTLLGAEAGRYQGKDVFLLVVTDPADTTKVTAHVVEAACAKQASPKPGKLLLTQSYARP